MSIHLKFPRRAELDSLFDNRQNYLRTQVHSCIYIYNQISTTTKSIINMHPSPGLSLFIMVFLFSLAALYIHYYHERTQQHLQLRMEPSVMELSFVELSIMQSRIQKRVIMLLEADLFDWMFVFLFSLIVVVLCFICFFVCFVNCSFDFIFIMVCLCLFAIFYLSTCLLWEKFAFILSGLGCSFPPIFLRLAWVYSWLLFLFLRFDFFVRAFLGFIYMFLLMCVFCVLLFIFYLSVCLIFEKCALIWPWLGCSFPSIFLRLTWTCSGLLFLFVRFDSFVRLFLAFTFSFICRFLFMCAFCVLFFIFYLSACLIFEKFAFIWSGLGCSFPPIFLRLAWTYFCLLFLFLQFDFFCLFLGVCVFCKFSMLAVLVFL